MSKGLTLEWTDLVDGSGREIRLFIPTRDMAMAEFTQFDRALFEDIDSDPNATISDRLLGLETQVRRIEEAAHPTTTLKADDSKADV